MTKEMKKWIACGAFALLALVNLIELIGLLPVFSDYHFGFSTYFLSLLDFAAIALIAAGIFIGMDLLVTIGGGVQVLMVLYNLIMNVVNLRYGVGDHLLLIVSNLLSLVVWGLIALMPYAKSAAPIAGIAAAAGAVLRFIVLLIRSAVVDYLVFGHFSFLFWITLLILIGGSLIAGLYFGERAVEADRKASGYGAPYSNPAPGAYPTNPYVGQQPNYPPQQYYPPQQQAYPPQQPYYTPQQQNYPPQQQNYPPQQQNYPPQQQDYPPQQGQDYPPQQ